MNEVVGTTESSFRTKKQKRFLSYSICICLLISTQATLLAYLSLSTSPNHTEVGHIGASVYFWHTGKLDVFHVNPPLIRIVAGLPIALFCKPKYDWTTYSPKPQDRCEWTLGTAFINANELGDLRRYVFFMRLACIPFVLIGGYFGFRFASELYGKWPGILFLVLWTFSPLVLGWGATICPDVSAASLGIVGLYTFWHWLKSPTWKQAIIAGICLGLMPLTKMTWIIAFPIWCLLFLTWKLWRKPDGRNLPIKQFALLLLIAVYILNSGYFYDGSFKLLKDYQFTSLALTGEKKARGNPVKPGNRFKNSLIGYTPVPLPSEFVLGIDTQKLDFERGLESYARGVWSDHGWWWYYGYVLLLKEPLGIWVMGGLVLLTSCFSRRFNASWWDELIVLIPLLLIFVFLSSQDGFSIHPRYTIIILPLLYIFIAKIARSFTLKKSLLAIVTAGCLIWIVVSGLSHYPHSMSYFNELAGGPKNWPKHLLGSNIDFGQNLYELKAWINEQNENQPIYITYEQSISPERLGIVADEVPTQITSGKMVVSVNFLFANNDRYAWLRKLDADAMIGYTMWIYNIEQDPSIQPTERQRENDPRR